MGPEPMKTVRPTMKPRPTLILSLLAAASAALVMVANSGLGGIVFTALGAVALLTLDYGKRIDPVRVRAHIIPIERPQAVLAGERRAA